MDETGKAKGSNALAKPSLRLILGVSLAIAARVLVILFLSPTTDVYYYDTQAAQALLSGMNPYGHTFVGIPPSLITPGATNVFAYLPLTALYLIPFQLLGDVRIGFILADIGVALSLYLAGGKRELASLVYLLVPFTIVFSTIYLNNALISILFLSLFFYFEQEGRPLLSASSLGLSLAAIQFTWIVFPLLAFHLIKGGRFKHLALALVIAALATLPLALLDLNDFLSDTIFFQFSRPVLQVITLSGPIAFDLVSLLYINVNLSLNGLLLTLLGFTLPIWLRAGALLVLLPFFIRMVKNPSRLPYASGCYLLLSMFVLPNEFFLPYFEMPFFLLLAYYSRSFSQLRPTQALIQGKGVSPPHSVNAR
jgi:hypothetical protein